MFHNVVILDSCADAQDLFKNNRACWACCFKTFEKAI